MSGEQGGKEMTYIVRLEGIRPGISREELVAALQRLYPGRSSGEIERALEHIPLVLTRRALEDQAEKIRRFLESKGAVVSLTPHTDTEEPIAKPTSDAHPPPAPTGPPGGIERRARPRVHPGIQLRPLGIGEILDRSFRMLREHFMLLFLILFIPQFLVFALNTAFTVFSGGEALQAGGGGLGIGMGISIGLTALIFIVIQFWAQGALIHAVSETYLGHSTSVKSAYGAIRPRLGRLIGSLFLMGVFIGLVPAVLGILAAVLVPVLHGFGINRGVLVLLGIGAVVLAVWAAIHFMFNFLMVDKVVVIENLGWMQALRRSKELMKARTETGFWKGPKMKASLILLLGGVIAVGIHLVVQVPGAVVNFLLPGHLAAAAFHGFLQVVSNCLATVFTATALILYYYDIRVRKEGFDLKMMAENL
ncbi:MAG: hypothetical protein JRH13_09435 [Deltaproteobacteria bacterium]|nr:hypothetical protein [Deltaproteobacteria bacterium]MBW2016945.1 hypothetical protein [Deltaproteobacteria bacterium]MBW2129572.1 hypothetical protein [Deltaproteobacteria bacterium]